MFLEAQHDIEPDLVWPVKVIENVGGRLLLRYEAAESANGDFWLFYLHHRLHPIGWARSHDCTYRPPTGLLADFHRMFYTSSSAMAERPRELDQRFQVGVQFEAINRLKGYFSRHCDMTQFTLTCHMVNKPFLLLSLAAEYRSRRRRRRCANNIAADHHMFITLADQLS